MASLGDLLCPRGVSKERNLLLLLQSNTGVLKDVCLKWLWHSSWCHLGQVAAGLARPPQDDTERYKEGLATAGQARAEWAEASQVVSLAEQAKSVTRQPESETDGPNSREVGPYPWPAGLSHWQSGHVSRGREQLWRGSVALRPSFLLSIKPPVTPCPWWGTTRPGMTWRTISGSPRPLLWWSPSPTLPLRTRLPRRDKWRLRVALGKEYGNCCRTETASELWARFYLQLSLW